MAKRGQQSWLRTTKKGPVEQRLYNFKVNLQKSISNGC